LYGASAALAIGGVGVGLADAFWPSVVLLLLAIAAMGVATPVQQAYVHEVVPSTERATVVSFISMVGSAGGIGGPIGLSYLTRAQSPAAGYVAGGFSTLFALPFLWALRRRCEPADFIHGRAGKRAPCAAQGLPEVATLDTTPRQPEFVK
jgi:MFS family permease